MVLRLLLIFLNKLNSSANHNQSYIAQTEANFLAPPGFVKQSKLRIKSTGCLNRYQIKFVIIRKFLNAINFRSNLIMGMRFGL